MDKLQRPVPVSDSLTPSALTLLWKIPEIKDYKVTYKVHKKMKDMDSGWQLHVESNFSTRPRGHLIKLTHLKPFVTYRVTFLCHIQGNLSL